MQTRSDFLRAGGALLLAAGATSCANHVPEAVPPQGTLSPLAWVRVTPLDRVEVLVSKSEMGQGIATGFVTIIAEELDARLDQIDVIYPVADENFDDPVLHQLLTGGSFSTSHMYPALRRAGATARAMLVSAAAARWGVNASTCSVHDGSVVAPGGHTASFGSLAGAASALTVPQDVVFKDPATYRYVGKFVPRVDISGKVDGSAKFGIDTVVPGMKYATVVHPPCFGASFESVDDAKARKVQGVIAVYPIDSGVAVVAENTWAAFQGARALDVRWNEPAAKPDSTALFTDAALLASSSKAKEAWKIGDPSTKGATSLSAQYTGPFLAHAAMEPINATAWLADGKCYVVAPTQVQTGARADAAKAAGVSFDDVILRTSLIGGGFGRRLRADYVREAVQIAKQHGTPVKLTWTREEDIQHDVYRPMFHSEIRAELDANGHPIALAQTIVSPSSFRAAFPEYSNGKIDGEYFAGVGGSWNYVSNLFLRGVDLESIQGAYDTPYAFPNLLISYAEHDAGVPVGDMRAPQANWNSFVLETFLDECAEMGKVDAVEMRRKLFASSSRATAVLDRLLAMSQFPHHPVPAGHALGLAFAGWLGSLSATVAEVSLVERLPKVHNLWIAADIGRVINPDNAKAQLEGGALFGLSMARTGKISLQAGRVQQSNFNDYTVLRMADAPAVHVAIVDSSADPTGVGELGVPAVAPAVANALFRLTGKRLRNLPLSDALA